MLHAPTIAGAILLLSGLLKGPLALVPEAGPPVPVPSVIVQDFAGGEIDLRDAVVTGEVIVLNFWATWCAPCKQEMPTLAALQDHFQDDDLRVVALAMDRASQNELKAFMEEVGAGDLEILRDPGMATAAPMEVRGLPVTVVIDRAGNEVFRHAGFADWAAPEVVAFVGTLLEQPGS